MHRSCIPGWEVPHPRKGSSPGSCKVVAAEPLHGTTGPCPSDFGLHNLKAGATQGNCNLGRPNVFSAPKK